MIALFFFVCVQIYVNRTQINIVFGDKYFVLFFVCFMLCLYILTSFPVNINFMQTQLKIKEQKNNDDWL